jgi:hypothetical protein
MPECVFCKHWKATEYNIKKFPIYGDCQNINSEWFDYRTHYQFSCKLFEEKEKA